MGFGFSSYINRQTPQQNQTLQGNPATDTEAQTSWMNPSSSDSNWAEPKQASGSADGSSFQMSGGLLGNGTALSSLTNGNTGFMSQGGSINDPRWSNGTWGGSGGIRAPITGGHWEGTNFVEDPAPQSYMNSSPSGNTGQYMPEGYDQGKWNDPNKHDPKYDIGRILSRYPPGPEGLRQAAGELAQNGFSVTGKDSIFRNDVGNIDVGRSFGAGNGAWQWNPIDMSGGGGSSSPVNSYMGQPAQDPNQQKFLQQLMFQIAQQNQPNTFQPMGGGSAATAGNPNQFYGIGSDQNGTWF